jgi:thiamine pyrophosphate-dependent acetolactate synthase large subunit-like protein
VKRSIDGGEALLAAFAASGADYIFCCSGSEWAPLWEALARRKLDGESGPRYLDTWHETVAVGMATGYTLVTGRPQPVLLHAGGGLLQGACAVQGALLANVPMVVFSSESITYGERAGIDPGSQWYRNLSIVGGPHNLAAPAFKWSNQAPSIETLFEMVLRTTELSQRAPAGPCYLNVPVEVLLDAWSPPTERRMLAPPGRKVSPSEEIGQLVERLLRASNPVVLTETAGRDSAAYHALVELCDLLAIPVIETQGAVSSNFPRSHPMHLGSSVELFEKTADLVLLVNCRAPWYPPSCWPPGSSTVVIDEVPQRPYVAYQVLHADQYLEGAVSDTLRLTVAALRLHALPEGAIAERRARHSATHAGQWAAQEQAERKSKSAGDVIDAVRLVSTLRALAPADTVFVDETITHSRLLQQHLRLDRPEGYFYVQGGLGQGIAVALGVKLAVRQRPVVLAIGDGSYLYNPVLPSLAAARNLQLPVLILVFNNRQYLSMKYNHLREYPDGVAKATRYFPGTDLAGQPDLAGIAASFDMFGVTVSDPAVLEQQLAAAFAQLAGGRSAIVNVMLDK